ncbi:MAG: hypothetical protein R2820_07275 [Cyclobacteriaceae bacterium]
MRRVTSNYKIFGGFGLFILLNGLIGIGTFKLLTTLDIVDLMTNANTQKVYAFVIGLQLFFLYLFSTQNRFIIADSDGITFVNPILPFLRSTYRWTDFDYYVMVDESSQHSTHEAVWLIKGKRLKARFSSFYYSNYDDLIDQVKTTSKGDKYFGPFDQLFILMGLKGVKDK